VSDDTREAFDMWRESLGKGLNEGVTVIKQEDGWYCDAHGSKFEVDGALNMGPATSGLSSVPVKVSKGTVTVGYFVKLRHLLQ
jgi:nitrite reductase/ring-hydroxylating ferredoxin subunit